MTAFTRSRMLVAAALLTVASFTGCEPPTKTTPDAPSTKPEEYVKLDGKPEEKRPAPAAPTEPETTKTKPAASSKALATAEHTSGVKVEVLEVSLDETQNKLKVVWRYVNETKKPIKLVNATGAFAVPRREVPYHQFFDEVNYRIGKLDAAEAVRYPVVKTTDGRYYDATDIRKEGIVVPAEGSFRMYAKFPKPVVETDRIHLQLPGVEQFENLPIAPKKPDA